MLIIKCINANANPVTPNDFLALNNLSEIDIPRFFKGLSEKLKVNKINEASETPLFKINRGKSFHGTPPNILYRNTAYPTDKKVVIIIIFLAYCFLYDVLFILEYFNQ